MTVELLTANTLAAEPGIPGMRIARAVRRRVITPDGIAGRTLLFLPRCVPRLRAQLGIHSKR